MNVEVTPDLINGLFQVAGAVIQWGNVVRIRRHKSVKGFDPKTIAFFSIYGLWCLYFFQGLNQWMSFIGGLMIVAVNIIWLTHVFYYWMKERKREKIVDKYRGRSKESHCRKSLGVPTVETTNADRFKILGADIPPTTKKDDRFIQ